MAGNVTSLTRVEALRKLLDDRRDIDAECGYPTVISIEQYEVMYNREGIAQRVVGLLPQECWSDDPTLVDDDDAEETPFEEAWRLLTANSNIYHYLHRVDELSGIGRFGVLLLGVNDGKSLNEPVDGVGPDGKKAGESVKERELLFMRPFSEKYITITAYEVDEQSPRFGLPVMYELQFQDVGSYGSTAVPSSTKGSVHWTRIIHVADNRKSSEMFGQPRMEPVWNRLYDLRKLYGGSAEMFWNGAFPGLSFEVNPELEDVEVDTDAIKEQVKAYMNGLQRYLQTQGMTVKSLAVQVADPDKHIMEQLKAIAILISCPWRIFVGTESAHLASDQDQKAWNKRLTRRRTKYLSPLLIRPFVDRLIAMGVMPEPADEEYRVDWPDLDVPTEKERMEMVERMVKALAMYIQAGVETLLPPREFLIHVMDFEAELVEEVLKAAEELIAKTEAEEDDDQLEPSGVQPGQEEDIEPQEEA